jgi:hypothetical protein
MRSVLVLAIATLGITLLLNLVSSVGPRSSSEILSVIAISKGRLLPPARLGGQGPETLPEGILAGDLSLHVSYSQPGLRVAVFEPEFRFEGHWNYDLARSAHDVAAFLDAVPPRKLGSLLVLAGYGNFRPATPETESDLPELEARLTRLGAESDPLRAAGASWAMITVRRPDGWVKLAESYSEELGVSASFVLSSDLSLYDDYQGDLAIVRAVGPVAVPLEIDVSSADHATEGVRRNRWAQAGGVHRPSISMDPPHVGGGERALAVARWDGVALGRRPRFASGIGLANGTARPRGEVTFRLLVDGVVVGEESLRGPMPAAWQPFEVDLAPYAEQRVTLELQAEEDADAATCVPLWGLPVLRYSSVP